jgi:DamX protein
MVKGAQRNNLAGAYAAFQQEQQASGYLLSANVAYQSPERQRQLDTLLHLSHFTDYLLLLTAPFGAGKSYFAEQFLLAQPTDTCVVHIDLEQSASPEDLLQIILSSLPETSTSHQSISESVGYLRHFSATLAAQDQVFLVVIDNAHCLSDSALELLATIVIETGPADACPHIVLLAEPELAKRMSTPAFADLRQERYYQFSLAPFTQSDSRAYLRQLLDGLGLPGDAAVHDGQLDQLHQAAQGVPGYVDMLFRQALRQGNLEDKKTGWPWWHIVAITFMAAALVALWWLTQPFTNSVSDGELPVVAQQSVASLEQPMPEPLPALEPLPLSPEPSYQSFQPQEVAIDENAISQVEDLVDLQHQQQIDQLIVKSQDLQAQLLKVGQTLDNLAIPITQVKMDQDKPVKSDSRTQTLAPGLQEFLNLPTNFFTLQLLGARYETTAKQFVKRLPDLNLPVYLLQSQRDGEPWFVVLVGSFATQKAANKALSSLPRKLRDQEPWLRPVKALQQRFVNKMNAGGE